MRQAIETIGPYAGILAMLGFLAVSLLLFSMARDLRRLREWAGGAPERDAEIREVSEVVAEEKSQELKILAEREERRMEREGLVTTSFWDRLGRGGRIMAIVAGVLVLGAAAAFAGTSLLGDDDGGGAQGNGNRNANGQQASGLRPAQIRADVLNGTGGAEAGLAAEYAAVLERKGFKVGSTGDAPSTFDDSTVMFMKGNEAAAKKVAQALDISDTRLITNEVADLSSGATVTAVIGISHSELPAGG